MVDLPVVSFEEFLEALIADRILDLNYDGILPRLVVSVRKSYSEGLSTPFGPLSSAAAIFLKASQHKDTYRRNPSEPIFKPHEARKYIQQRNTIIHWFKRAKEQPSRRDFPAPDPVETLVRIFNYSRYRRRDNEINADTIWNDVITGDELSFTDSDTDDTSDVHKDDADGARPSDSGEIDSESTLVKAEVTALPHVTSNTTSHMNICTGSSKDPYTNGIFTSHPSVKEECPDPGGSVHYTSGINDDPSAIDVIAIGITEIDRCKGENVVVEAESTSNNNSDIVSPDCCRDDTVGNSTDTNGPVAINPPVEATTSEGEDRKYFCNTAVVFYGGANLVTACYYFIKQLVSKPISDLISYPEHLRSRHSFILWQNAHLQHICCRELMFAYSSNEITHAKLVEILTNKKSKCCVLEDIDLLPTDLQLLISKQAQKNDRPFLFLTRNIHQISLRIRSLSFTFRVPPIDVTMLIESALSSKLCPTLFAGVPRNSIVEFATRARDDLLWFYHGMINLQQKKFFSFRRDILPLKRIVHCIAFQEKNLRTIMFIKDTVTNLVPIYMRNPFIFWLDFLDEFDSVVRSNMLGTKERLHHLIAEKSTILANVPDPRTTLEATFLEMMDIVSVDAPVRL
ncbi:integral membrane protein protein, putative [Babesia ovis]|uniref:Integral membrane protein protein, putative n=1 Tax=Babesia ovis TaxID=5869 RepID=A0A9W5T8P1_BABOV|nr:integral membrane protein protein, putative [Babesia ovis]